MPEVSLLVMLAIVVFAGIIIFKVVKGVVQALLLTSAVAVVALAVAGGFVVMDALDLKNNFAAGGKLMLFSTDNGTRITSGLLVNGNESMQPLSGAEIEQFNAELARRDYAAMKGNNFKLILLREEPLLASMPEELNLEGGTVSREMMMLQLRAAAPEQRAQLLSVLFAMQLGKNPLSIISGYREGEIMIYPETAVFKVARILPESLFRKVSEKLLGKDLQPGLMGKAMVPAA